jgi:hypothetical protein
MGPETRVPKIQIADVDLHIFFLVAPQSATKASYIESYLGGWTEMLYCKAQAAPTDDRRLESTANGTPCTTQQQLPPTHRGHGDFFLFAACSSHGRKIVDLYIYEQFGQLLVTVEQLAFQIAEYSLLKMLRSRCSATIVQRHISRTAHCSRTAT